MLLCLKLLLVSEVLFSLYFVQYCHSHTDVYLSLNDDIIPNHGYVEISRIGSTDDSALLCHTNRPPDGAHSGGDWLAPDGNRVFDTDVPGVTRNRDPMVVRLRRTSGDPPEGIYQCTIDDALTPQIVHVGLYNTGGGIASALQISFSTSLTIQVASWCLPYLHTLTSMDQLLSSPSPVSPLEDLLPLSLGPETPSLSLKELRLC